MRCGWCGRRWPRAGAMWRRWMRTTCVMRRRFMHGNARPDKVRGAELVRVERGGAEHLPEVLALAGMCQDAPHWPAEAWPAFVQGEGEGRHAVLLLARGREGELLGWL